MKNRLALTNFAISVMGVLSFFFVFGKIFLDKYDYNLPLFIIMIVCVCGIASLINVYLKRAWVFYCILSVTALIYLWFFRYEIIGGYMEFFNKVVHDYAIEFNTALYFATPYGKWITDSDVVLMAGYTLVILSMIYSLLISKRKLIAIPLLVNIVFFVIPLVINKVPPVIFIILNFVFVIEMFVMAGISRNGSSNETSIAYIQTAALGIGAVIMIICVVGTLIVPQSGYSKSPYFDKVGDFAVNVYERIEQKIISASGSGHGGTSSIIDDGKKVIENNNLGQVDSINYSYNEMFLADIPKDVDRIYIKQFIGKEYADNTWIEIKREDSAEIDRILSGYETSTQEMTSNFIAERINQAEKGMVSRRWMGIQYTGMLNERQLMPIYAFTEDESLFDYESYYKKIDDGIHFEYFDVDPDAVESLILEQNSAELAYRDYVYQNYLQTDSKCEKQFRELLKSFKTDTYSDIMYMAEYVRQHLMERCQYTLKPGKVPSGEDFVDYFYNSTKKGYCTYFATTAVMMLRSKGVPARYVTGFFFRPDDNVIEVVDIKGREYNRVSVDDSHAHAWIEIYINGFGWIQFDVTPGNFEQKDIEVPKEIETTSPTPTVEQTTGEKEKPTQKPTTTKQEPTTTKANENVPTEKIRLSKTAKKNIICGLITILVITVVISYILIRYRVITTKRRLVYEDCRTGDTRECIIINYEKFERILSFAGFVRPMDMTYKKYAEKLMNECHYLSKESIEEITELYEKAEFSGNEISENEIIKSECIVDELCNKVYTDIGFFKKIRYKYFCNLI